ncbi:MAG: insulinase family protein [Prevotella sp.]|nr:insulinase family protein [Prevotella sp.]
MKLKAMVAALLLSIGLGAQAQTKNYTYKTVPGDPMHTRIYTLDNGLKVYLSVNPEKPRLQANIAVRTGSRNDPAETTGLAHYLEHLMFKGTKQFGTNNPTAEAPLLNDIERRFEHYRTLTDSAARRQAYHEIDSVSQIAAQYFIPNEYDKLMSAIGSEGTNAYTSNDVTCYVENIPSNEIENWARIQADRFQNMVIRGFHTELEAVYEEYNIGLARDVRKEYNAGFAKLFPGHPYGTQTTIGTQEHLKNPSIVNIKNYFNRYYVPNNVAIILAGDFNPDETIQIIDRYFGSWKASPTLSRPEYAPVKQLTAPVDTTVVGLEAENVMMLWRFNAGNDAQVDTLEVISDMLANGKAGLFEVDLEHTMLTMGVSASCYALTDYSAFYVFGRPKEGQSLEELRTLILGEFDKLKRGDFSDDLLPAVINNKKLAFYKSLDSNDDRADYMVDAFINNVEWDSFVNQIDRQSRMTKQQIVDFANRHFGDNYVTVFKRQGVDSTLHKIDKPQITAIPTNRDQSSAFLSEIANSEVKPIQPRFVDFQKDLTVSKTKKKLPLLYKQNTDDGLFQLTFMYDFGEEDQLDLAYAADYLDYIGTADKTVTQIKQQFYKLACNYSINVNSYYTTVSLNGLTENMPAALSLLEDLLQNAKGDTASYHQYVKLLIKSRNEAKSNQRSNFSALRNYVQYGPYNPTRNVRSDAELEAMNPDHLTGLLKNLSGIEHTVMYYGPMKQGELDKLLAKVHKTSKKLAPVPEGKRYELQQTPQTEIYLAPYDAKNIYMMQINNEGRMRNYEDDAQIELFNEYFGGSMNAIVFQELREARGLAYSAAAYYSTSSRPQTPDQFYTYIICQNDKMTDCITTFNSILDTIPQSQAAFEIAKQSLGKSLESGRVTKFSVLNRYYWAKKQGIDFDVNERIYQKLPSLTLQNLVDFEQQRAARKPYKYLILGDEENLDIKALEKIAPIKRLTTDEIFGY